MNSQPTVIQVERNQVGVILDYTGHPIRSSVLVQRTSKDVIRLTTIGSNLIINLTKDNGNLYQVYSDTLRSNL